MTDPDLNAAYALNGPEDCRRLYAAWADSYDHDFARAMDYRLPRLVAQAFLAAGGTGPEGGAVLDVGAGTGLLGLALRGEGFEGPVDGLDLSPEMLALAGRLGLYRELLNADVTRPLELAGGYGGLVSSGTFTHGHVGPSALPGLLALLRPGALVAISVNAGVWAEQGFAAALDALAPCDLSLAEAAIYGPAADGLDPGHAADRALIVTFRTR